jgi:predicted acetyltransferase
MDILLRPLTRTDKKEQAIYDMLQECPPNENGFLNRAFGMDLRAYADWVVRNEEISRGVGLPDGYLRQTIYWMYVDGRPVGSAKLRPDLNDALRIEGGNIGYGIRPAERGKGYGRMLLGLMLAESRCQGLERVLVTIDNANAPSLRVAVANGGKLEKRTPERSYFWFDLLEKRGGLASKGDAR